MAEPSLIRYYLEALSAQLPAWIVEELADGIDQTRRHYLGQGMSLDEAEKAAIAEFGDPQVIVAACTGLHPARRTARLLLATGPIAGAAWAAALITGKAWTWPIAIWGLAGFGLALAATAALLVAAALGTRYRPVRRAGTAGWLGVAALDGTMLTAVGLVLPARTSLVLLAMTASASRLALSLAFAAHATLTAHCRGR